MFVLPYTTVDVVCVW